MFINFPHSFVEKNPAIIHQGVLSTPRQRQCQAQQRLRRTAQSLFRRADRAARAARADVHGGVAWVQRRLNQATSRGIGLILLVLNGREWVAGVPHSLRLAPVMFDSKWVLNRISASLFRTSHLSFYIEA